ncbi:hypothetical protein Unana1_01822 [Umbelopsis nana]
MRITPLALVAALMAVSVNAVPHSKRSTCQSDNDCPGVTCCNLNTNTCVNDPNGTICDIPPTKTTTLSTTVTKSTTTKSTTTATATSTGVGCTTDDDCPGVTCCNLNTNTCVNDPNGTICDIPPTKTPTTTTTKTSSTTTTTKTSSTTTTTKTSSTTTTTKTSSATTTTSPTTTTTTATASPTSTGVHCATDNDCPGVTCCNLNTNTCVNDPNGTICDIPPTKTTTTGTKTTTTGTKTTTTTTATATATGPSKLTVVVNSNTLCFFLPPSYGGNIADSEKTAKAFCDSSSDAPGATQFPSGFIQSSHFKSGTGSGAYVQYTGLIDPSKYGLSSSDEGGQYDNHGSGSPPGSICAGYKYYVNLVEPAEKDYCIRCCQNSADCPTGRSTAGCASLIPGDYSIVLSTNSPLTQPGSAPVSNAHAAAVKEVIWTAPTRQEVASNATLQKALKSSVFPLGVGLDKPYK